MHKAIEIAKYVINYSQENGSPISNLKLQKLLYYIQAAVLVKKGCKCFDDPIVAWEFGPVVVEVYQRYREFGRNSIPIQDASKEMVFDANKMRIVFNEPKKLNDSERKIIDEVIDSYSHIKDPFDLVKKTHQEDPWKKTKLNSEIDCKSIKEYYLKNPEKIYI